MNTNSKRLDSRVLNERDYVVLFCVGYFILSILYGFLSEGTFGDDNIGYYLRAKAVINKPELAFNGQGPIFLFLYSLPAQFGYWGMEFLTSLICAITVFFTWNIAKIINLPNRYMVLLAITFQPIFFILSFSANREPLCALILTFGIFYYLKNNFIASSVMFSLLPLVRIELSIITGVWFLIFWRRNGISISHLLFILPVSLWQATMWFIYDNPLWLSEKIFSTVSNRIFYVTFGPLHWPQMLIFLVGPVLFTFLIIALAIDLYHRKIDFLWITLILTFMMYTVLTILPLGGGANLRHFVTISPIAAILSAKGFGYWLNAKKGSTNFKLILFSLIITTAVTLIFMSYTMWGHLSLSTEREFTKFSIIGFLLVAFIFISYQPFIKYSRIRLISIIQIIVSLLIVLYTFKTEPLLGLSDQHKTVKRIADWFKSSEYSSNIVYTNHIWFYYFIGQNPFEKEVYPRLTQEILKTSEKGSIMIWEPHYAPRLLGDVPYGALSENKNFEGIGAIYSPDSSYMTAVFIKKYTSKPSKFWIREYPPVD